MNNRKIIFFITLIIINCLIISCKELLIPTYVDTKKFVEKMVVVGPYNLNGALDLPIGLSQFPALVLVPGTGPTDMDETIEDIKPFRDIAEGLASRGIAVIRFEKRTRKGIAVRTVVDEYIEDANAAFTILEGTPGINKIFILGHSMGGTLAPRIARSNPKVAGIVILAGTSLPYDELIVKQLEYQIKLGYNLVSLLDKMRKTAKQISDPDLKPDDKIIYSNNKGIYFLDLRKYKAIEAVAALTIPVFIGWGTRDLKAIPEDFENWRRAFDKNPNVTIKIYDGLQHFFTRVGYARAHVEPVVIDDLAKWIELNQNVRE